MSRAERGRSGSWAVAESWRWKREEGSRGGNRGFGPVGLAQSSAVCGVVSSPGIGF